jgi:hypothetical protein
VFVLHQANIPSGGRVSQIEVGDFLARGYGPEQQARGVRCRFRDSSQRNEVGDRTPARRPPAGLERSSRSWHSGIRWPPTLNLKAPDSAGDGIDFVANHARPMEMKYAISNGFGFGGVNASALFRRWTDKLASESVGGSPDPPNR